MNDLSPSFVEALHDGAAGRMRFTEEQFFQMADAGVFDMCGKVELLDGEVFLSPQHVPHSRIQKRLLAALDQSVRLSGRTELETLPETTVATGGAYSPQCDLLIIADGDYPKAVPIAAVRLIVEVAASDAWRDEHIKKALYADNDVPEYWIALIEGGYVDCFSEPAGNTYRRFDLFAFGDAIASVTLPGIGVPAGWDRR